MADTEPPAPLVEGPRQVPPARRISAVWLIPLLALLVSLAVAWRAYDERGPLIEITFENAAGIDAGQTSLRFRDVTVGKVEAVRLTPDLNRVVVSARLDKGVATHVDADAKFWVVRPSVTTQGISGLDTVVSGVYINSFWDDQPGPPATSFVGLPMPPLTPAGQPGSRVRLRAKDGGSMTVGAPVLFKGIQVGRVENIELTEAGDVMIDIFVNAPNNARLTEGTRFWNASGFDVTLGPSGASLNVASLLSLVQGGMSFDLVGSDTTPVPAGYVYTLYSSQTDARKNIFENATGFRQMVDVVFDGSVRGLTPGARVEFRGIGVGEVAGLQATVIEGERGPKVALRTTLSIMPQSMGIAEGTDAEMSAATLDLLQAEVSRGMRARLATSGLLSQTLYVDLAVMDDAPDGVLQRDAQPYPVLPSAPSDVSGLTASAEGVMQRLSSLPIEDLMSTAQTLLANVNAVVSDERVRSAPEDLGLLIGDLRKVVAEPGVQDAPARLAAILTSVQGVVDQVNEQQLVAKLGTALDTTSAAVAAIGATTSDAVPKVVARIDALAARIDQLPLEELLSSGNELVTSVDTLVRSEGVSEVPANLNASLAEVRGLLTQLREGGAVENVTATLGSARKITQDLAQADLVATLRQVATEAQGVAGNVNAATTELPALIANLNTLSERASQMPLNELVANTTALLGTADKVLGAQGMDQLPAALAGSLEELQRILAQLREGGAVANVNETLASAGAAADAVTRAAADLPALMAQLNRVAAQADATLAGLAPDSPVNRETLALLRQVSISAKSINDLVQQLQRQPNSVIFGR